MISGGGRKAVEGDVNTADRRDGADEKLAKHHWRRFEFNGYRSKYVAVLEMLDVPHRLIRDHRVASGILGRPLNGGQVLLRHVPVGSAIFAKPTPVELSLTKRLRFGPTAFASHHLEKAQE